jgi:polar amino acid transport system permease protein
VNFDTDLIARSLPEIFGAFGITLLMWFAGAIGAALLGFFVAVGRRYGRSWLAVPLWALVGLSLDPITAGLLGLTVYGAAYFSEIFRGGFEAVPAGHIEAAECVGLTRTQIVRRILMPEMTMLVLPASVNMAIVLLKETAVLSIITVPELTLVISAIGSQQYAFAESLFLLALFYWGLVELAGRLGRFMEDRLSRYRFAAA